MTTPTNPRPHQVVIEGEPYDLIPYGLETDYEGDSLFTKPCHICGAASGELHLSGCRMGAGNVYERPEPCRDCGVSVGQIHFLTCGIEQCPRCRGQYMSCLCESNEDNPKAAEE